MRRQAPLAAEIGDTAPTLNRAFGPFQQPFLRVLRENRRNRGVERAKAQVVELSLKGNARAIRYQEAGESHRDC